MIFAITSGSSALDYFVIILLTLVAVCVSLVLHEVAHGLVALWNGDPTAKFAGRLTLNPMKHFDIIGFIMMMLVGFGYAKPVPVNPYNFKHRTRGQVTVAIAGVTVNLILAFISSLFVCLMVLALNHATTDGTARLCWYAYQFFFILTSINLSLLFFNIIPVFPLDGFRLIEALTRRGNRFCAFMRTNGQYILWGLVGLSFIVSSAAARVSLPFWFEYLDILGTYLNFFVTKLFNLFTSFWGLMVPIY